MSYLWLTISMFTNFQLSTNQRHRGLQSQTHLKCNNVTSLGQWNVSTSKVSVLRGSMGGFMRELLCSLLVC